jgi:hypothetical protein
MRNIDLAGFINKVEQNPFYVIFFHHFPGETPRPTFPSRKILRKTTITLLVSHKYSSDGDIRGNNG